MSSRSASDLAILGCRVRTLDSKRPFATAVAVRDGVIVCVGDDSEVRAMCDGRTEVVNGDGMALVPGLTDVHQHALSAPDTRGADLTAVKSVAELRRAMAAERERAGRDGWVLGWGLDYNAFGQSTLSGDVFDAAVGGQPSVVYSMDQHTGIANRSALQLAGVTGPVKFEDGADVVCRDGIPTGELRGFSAIDLVAGVVPPPTRAEREAMVVEVLRACGALGITSAHQMGESGGQPLDLAQNLDEAGELDVRLVVPILHTSETGPEEADVQLSLGNRHGRLWRGGVVKFFVDGVIETGKAWLLEPDMRGGSTTSCWPNPASYADAVRRFADAGFQCVTHAVGDGGVRAALDAYGDVRSRSSARHRIEHIETLSDEDVPRFAREDVVASMQPLHMQWRTDDGSDRWTQLLGPEHCARAFRCRDLLDSGAIVALGSDWPVASYDPRVGMAWARLRREPKTARPAFEPGQRLSALEALEGYTTMAARAVGEESIAGRIREGFRADLTGFADDPVDCSADDLVELPVLLTMVDGRIVWRA